MKVSGEKLRAARKNANLSQEALAARLTTRLERKEPVHFTTVSRWENDHNQPDDIATVVAIAAECGIGDFRELLDGDEDEEDALLTVDPRDFGAAMSAIFDRAFEHKLREREAVTT